jgi:hypothetical protein
MLWTIDANAGWGTWIRTKIDGVRVRCSTVELSLELHFPPQEEPELDRRKLLTLLVLHLPCNAHI